MPGVPTGKGCDSCRRQKKKCDEAKPACTRCARRGIECIGAGEQRYKFKLEYGKNVGRKRAPRRESKKLEEKPEDRPEAGGSIVQYVKTAPSNPTTTLAHGLVSIISQRADLRYNLLWSYGGFLAMVPRRLGINPALDAAIDAMVTTHATFAVNKEITVQALSKYSRSLTMLRNCLDDPQKAKTSETLCAAYVLLLVQNMLGFGECKWTGHVEGATKILKARKSFIPQNEFDHVLLLSLRGPVLFEGVFNLNIDLTDQEWKDLVESKLDEGTQEGQLLRCFARLPSVMRRAKRNQDGSAGLEKLAAELRPEYATCRQITDTFQARLASVENPAALQSSPKWLHAHYQRFYAFSMTICLYFNFIITNLGGGDNQLRADASYMGTEMLTIAENAVIYRPFGAAYVALGLMSAWLATDNRPLRSLLEKSLADYQQDFHHQGLTVKSLEEAFYQLCPAPGRNKLSFEFTDTVEISTYDGL